MVDPSVGVGDIAVVRLFPTELVDHVLAGSGVESSEHGIRVDNGGFSWGSDGSGVSPAPEGDVRDGREGGERSRRRLSSEDGSLEVERGHGWGGREESGVGKVVVTYNRHRL